MSMSRINRKSERRKYANVLFRAIVNNKKEEWWKEEVYVQRYPLEESERALGNVFEVFDENWLKQTLNSWVERDSQSHHIINELVPKGLWPLVILVELGKDLEELRSISKFDQLVKELRNPSKFIAAWLETEIAAHCLRNRYSIELYPKIRGKIPDLKISTDSEEVLVEIKEIHPGESQIRYHEVMNFLSSMIMPNTPQGTSVEVSTNILPEDKELEPLARKIVQCLQSQAKEKVIPLKVGRLNVSISMKKDRYTSFSLVLPDTIDEKQLQRLMSSIKHEAEQIPSPYPGLVVLDAGVLQGFPDEIIRNVAVKTFEKYRLPNIIAVMIVRSYKFHRPEAETEIISVSNPYNARPELLKKFDKLFTFSRTRDLIARQ